MACKLTKSLDNKNCEYAVAGISALYLANWYPPVTGTTGATAQANAITYVTDTDGYLSEVILPTGEEFYKITGSPGTTSFTDQLLAGGNGGKYRQHTVNTVVNQYDVETLNEGDALSLGQFVAVAIDSNGRPIVLGRTNGLSAPAGGFDFNSGAAAADATGWTVILQGVSMEIAPIMKDATVIEPIYVEVITP